MEDPKNKAPKVGGLEAPWGAEEVSEPSGRGILAPQALRLVSRGNKPMAPALQLNRQGLRAGFPGPADASAGVWLNLSLRKKWTNLSLCCRKSIDAC